MSTQRQRDIGAVRAILSRWQDIFNPDAALKADRWVSRADVYLRAGEGLGKVITHMLSHDIIEAKEHENRHYLRMR